MKRTVWPFGLLLALTLCLGMACAACAALQSPAPVCVTFSEACPPCLVSAASAIDPDPACLAQNGAQPVGVPAAETSAAKSPFVSRFGVDARTAGGVPKQRAKTKKRPKGQTVRFMLYFLVVEPTPRQVAAPPETGRVGVGQDRSRKELTLPHVNGVGFSDYA